jgi:hypothetical protein
VIIWLPAALCTITVTKRRRGADEARFFARQSCFGSTTDLPQLHDKANVNDQRPTHEVPGPETIRESAQMSLRGGLGAGSEPARLNLYVFPPSRLAGLSPPVQFQFLLPR